MLDLETLNLPSKAFVRINVYTGKDWDLDALPGLLLALPGAAALGKPTGSAKAPTNGLARAIRRAAPAPGEADRSEKGEERARKIPSSVTVAVDLNVLQFGSDYGAPS